jgi:hypothetical protein
MLDAAIGVLGIEPRFMLALKLICVGVGVEKWFIEL